MNRSLPTLLLVLASTQSCGEAVPIETLEILESSPVDERTLRIVYETSPCYGDAVATVGFTDEQVRVTLTARGSEPGVACPTLAKYRSMDIELSQDIRGREIEYADPSDP